MAGVTGIGGVFFKARDPGRLTQWYAKHLGVKIEAWGGAVFDGSTGDATAWHIKDADGDGFAPSTAQVMINYRVDNLEELLRQLAAEGIEPIKGPDEAFNGRFAWVMDPEGNKVELWEPQAPNEQ